MTFDNLSTQRAGTPVNVTLEAMKEVAKDEQLELNAEQADSLAAFKGAQEEAVNPFAARFAKEKPAKPSKSRVQKMQETHKGTRLPIEKIRDSASQFQRNNQELRQEVLVLLREKIKPGNTKEEILETLLEFYPDVTLAYEALDFLIETTDGELAETVKQAKQDFENKYEREITAGRNVTQIAREASEKGLGTPTSLRDMYRDITGNPREPATLFEELSTKYAYKDLKKVIDYLLHSLGADFKSRGPSVPRGLLHRLFTETRSLQAILGVYRFFQKRMGSIEKQFDREGMEMPRQISFESLSKQFMSLVSERYPSAIKVMQLATKLGIDDSIPSKIIIFSQLRDAVRNVAMNQFKSESNKNDWVASRDNIFSAIIEALEDLENQLEDLEQESEGNVNEEGIAT